MKTDSDHDPGTAGHIGRGPGDGVGSYYAVIFSSRRTEGDAGYGDMAVRMEELAGRQPGFLGIESVRGADGAGITISYWRSLEDIRAWKAVAEHVEAQELGRARWYSEYRVRVARIEYEYEYENEARATRAGHEHG